MNKLFKKEGFLYWIPTVLVFAYVIGLFIFNKFFCDTKYCPFLETVLSPYVGQRFVQNFFIFILIATIEWIVVTFCFLFVSLIMLVIHKGEARTNLQNMLTFLALLLAYSYFSSGPLLVFLFFNALTIGSLIGFVINLIIWLLAEKDKRKKILRNILICVFLFIVGSFFFRTKIPL